MKCPTCESCEYAQYCGATEIMRKCERHNKKVKQTNEEWFCSLSTEDKAKWLSQRSQILYDCGQRDVFPKTMYEEDWETWLKEKHHG